MTCRYFAAPLLLLAMMLSASAQNAELGAPAAPLKIQSWVKGEPISLDQAKGNKVVVVEFWATWCGPCRTSIPHLTEMQEKYKDDVVFVGVSDETAEVVTPFVEKMGEQMDYRVAVDQNQETSKAYMAAYGVNGIPHAFIVDKQGAVAYHAHPMEPSFEEALQQVIAGKFDAKAMMEAAQKRQENLEKANTFLHKLATGENLEGVKQEGEELLKIFAEDAEVLNQLAWVIATQDFAHKDLDLALKAVEQASKLEEHKNAGILDTHARVLFELGRKEEALQTQRKALELAETDEEKQYMQEQIDMMTNGGEAEAPAAS